jgi:hypothetical protein
MTIMILHMVHERNEDPISARCMALGARFRVIFGSARILEIWLRRPVVCCNVCYIAITLRQVAKRLSILEKSLDHLKLPFST